ncbi:hypothetical protein Sste5346_008929 [Sporothrix stenoceras]|uniref:CRIB domain-containing protein n=1 Tax=Sporothrix stenoceras TaxID=5173 RepID=A0ABR3YN71_9PEZI
MPSSINRSGSISELLEPAMEGPPSPETLRAISNQMRLASTADKHQSQSSHQSHQSHHSRQSHQTTSSGSSSLRSLTSVDPHSWDKAFDNTSSLSRKSSGRSTASTAPRDRHESVQIFGKNIFGKRGRLRRESSAQSSSNSSLYSAETPFEKGVAISSPPPPPMPPTSSHGLPAGSSNISKEPLIPSFFSRRRAANKSGPPSEDLDGRRRLQISGPYNFQHLTHTQKEQLPNLQRGSRVALQSEFVSAQQQNAAAPVDGNLRGIQAESLHFPNFSSETLPIDEDAVLATVPRRSIMRPHASSVSSVYPPPRLNHSKSQDQLRIPPPRPPRSPIEASSFSPPIPPPRFSSRASLRPGDLDSMTTSPPRPRTSGGFRQPVPSTFSSADMPRPPLMHAHSYSADMNMPSFVDTRRFSQMPEVFIPPSAVAAATSPSATPDDSNWPLAAPAATSTSTFDILPGVPEEEEQVFNPRSSVRKSRMSIASNASSLRKSHSLPLLQQFPQPGSSNTQRPPSAASDTLGRFDLMAAQRSIRDADYAYDDDADSLAKANWEDDIDYCYEHEIEADCEYAWDRPSLDMSREDALDGVTIHENSMGSHAVIRTSNMAHAQASPHLLSPGCFDMPALSPASQTSMASMNEAVTPTTLAMRRPPGLTIQTGVSEEDELRPMHRFFHGRSGSRGSRASSFKESHGFNLSPSLFIPGNENYEQFRPPMRGAPVGFAIGADEEDEFPTYVESTMSMDKSMLFIPARTSASTTASRESRDSVLSDRHISANSTATDLTRLTMSTASIEDLMYKKDLAEVPQI